MSLTEISPYAGVKGVLVNLMSQKAEVKYDPAYLMPNQIANRISELGYEATVLESETSGQNTVDLLVRPEISIERNPFFCDTKYAVRAEL